MSSCTKSRLSGFLALALLGWIPADAFAAACCVSATNGVGRLRIWEQAAAGVTTSAAAGIGSWDRFGEWKPYGDTYSEYEYRASIWGIARVTQRAQAYLNVPTLVTHRAAGDYSGTGGGLADIQAGVRYDIFEIGEYLGVPAVALIANLTMPTGRTATDATADLGADTTGRGAWIPGLALSVETTSLPWFLQVNVGVTVPLPAEQPTGISQRFGPALAGSVVGGLELVPDVFVLSSSLTGLWESELHLDGDPLEDSSKTNLGIDLSVSWIFDPHWTLMASAETGFFMTGFGDNVPGRVLASMGLRYGFF